MLICKRTGVYCWTEWKIKQSFANIVETRKFLKKTYQSKFMNVFYIWKYILATYLREEAIYSLE